MLNKNIIDSNFRIYTVEVTLQSGEYRGKVQVKVKSNTTGAGILNTARIYMKSQKVKSNCDFRVTDTGCFMCSLRDKKDSILEVGMSLGRLDEYIVKLEILSFEEE